MFRLSHLDLLVQRIMEHLSIPAPIYQRLEHTLPLQQGPGTIELDHASGVQDKDLVSSHYRLEAMRDNDQSCILELGGDGVLDSRVGLVVNRSGGFVCRYVIVSTRRVMVDQQ